MIKAALFLGQLTTNRDGWMLLHPSHRALFVAPRSTCITGEGCGCRLHKCVRSNLVCKDCPHNYTKYYDTTPMYVSDFVRYFSIYRI